MTLVMGVGSCCVGSPPTLVIERVLSVSYWIRCTLKATLCCNHLSQLQLSASLYAEFAQLPLSVTALEDPALLRQRRTGITWRDRKTVGAVQADLQTGVRPSSPTPPTLGVTSFMRRGTGTTWRDTA